MNDLNIANTCKSVKCLENYLTRHRYHYDIVFHYCYYILTKTLLYYFALYCELLNIFRVMQQRKSFFKLVLILKFIFIILYTFLIGIFGYYIILIYNIAFFSFSDFSKILL